MKHLWIKAVSLSLAVGAVGATACMWLEHQLLG